VQKESYDLQKYLARKMLVLSLGMAAFGNASSETGRIPWDALRFAGFLGTPRELLIRDAVEGLTRKDEEFQANLILGHYWRCIEKILDTLVQVEESATQGRHLQSQSAFKDQPPWEHLHCHSGQPWEMWRKVARIARRLYDELGDPQDVAKEMGIDLIKAGPLLSQMKAAFKPILSPPYADESSSQPQ
jgi:hypothetical protein